MKNKKILAVGFVLLLLCFSFISAQNMNNVKYQVTNQEEIEKVEQTRNRFQTRYNFTCEGECIYGENEMEQTTLQIRERKKLFFFEVYVNAMENYILDDGGHIIHARFNFWSRILNLVNQDTLLNKLEEMR